MTAAMIPDHDGLADRQPLSKWFAPAVQPTAAPMAPSVELAPASGRRRRPDLTTPAGRIKHGYLGRAARTALAALHAEIDAVPEHGRDALPLGVLSTHAAVTQALRLALIEEHSEVHVGDSIDMWAVPCLLCGAEAGLACGGVESGTHVHHTRLWAVLLRAVMVDPEVLDLVEDARYRASRSTTLTAPPAPAQSVPAVDDDLPSMRGQL